MARIWLCKPIAALEAEASEPDVQAMTTHDGVPLKRSLSALNLVSLGIGDNRRRHFRAHRARRRRLCRAGNYAVVRDSVRSPARLPGCATRKWPRPCRSPAAPTPMPMPRSASSWPGSSATGTGTGSNMRSAPSTVAIGWSGYVIRFPQGFFTSSSPGLRPIRRFVRCGARRLARDRRAAQRAGDAGHRRGHRAPCRRPARNRARQQRHRGDQACHRRAVHRRGGAILVSTAHWVTASNPHGDFIPPNAGPGEYGLSGVVRGGRGRVLRVYRLQRRVDDRPGGDNPKRDLPIGILLRSYICTFCISRSASC